MIRLGTSDVASRANHLMQVFEKIPVRALLLACLAVTLLASAPVAAQTSDGDGSGHVSICDSSYISGVIEAVIQLSLWGAGAFAMVTYMATSAVESLPISRKHKETLKTKRGEALLAAGKVFAAGPVGLILINAADLPWASCISLLPF